MKPRIQIILAVLLLPGAALSAQGAASKAGGSFEDAANSVQKKLNDSIAELNKLREQVAAETLPLSRKLGDLESELSSVKLQYQDAVRVLDNSTLDLTNLRGEIKSRQEEAAYLSNLLGEYTRFFESRLHIAETQRHKEPIEASRLALENSSLTQEEIFKQQINLLTISLDRLEDSLGGTTFAGTAVDPGGKVQAGTFALLGPVALFLAGDGSSVGTAEQRLGSLEPAVIPFGSPADAEAARRLVAESKGHFPFDPTMGNAHKVEATEETLIEHVKKGGVVMYPILGLAGVALLVALLKWLGMLFIRIPSQKKLRAFLGAVAERNAELAMQRARVMGGPVGRMLVAGVEHIREPRELIEEVMYETVLTTRLKLHRFLPFVAITASSAPLLGLLGTVTGIMNTFTLMTVFGTGDVKTLSSGISEALITTEFGLYVAIPALLIYAFLSRKAKSVLDEMEKAAVAFINQVSKTPVSPGAETPGPAASTSGPKIEESAKAETGDPAPEFAVS